MTAARPLSPWPRRALAGCENIPAWGPSLRPRCWCRMRLLKAPFGAAAARYIVIGDPFAPNWTIENPASPTTTTSWPCATRRCTAAAAARRVRVFAAGRAGRPAGFGAYEVVRWQQMGIESGRPFAQRVAYGEGAAGAAGAARDVVNSAPLSRGASVPIIFQFDSSVPVSRCRLQASLNLATPVGLPVQGAPIAGTTNRKRTWTA